MKRQKKVFMALVKVESVSSRCFGMSQKKKDKEIEEKEDFNFACFGEYGRHWRCKDCKLRLACEQFTKEQEKSLYLRYKGKYKGRGKYRRKDRY